MQSVEQFHEALSERPRVARLLFSGDSRPAFDSLVGRLSLERDSCLFLPSDAPVPEPSAPFDLLVLHFSYRPLSPLVPLCTQDAVIYCADFHLPRQTPLSVERTVLSRYHAVTGSELPVSRSYADVIVDLFCVGARLVELRPLRDPFGIFMADVCKIAAFTLEPDRAPQDSRRLLHAGQRFSDLLDRRPSDVGVSEWYQEALQRVANS